jgi:hypothetical protein
MAIVTTRVEDKNRSYIKTSYKVYSKHEIMSCWKQSSPMSIEELDETGNYVTFHTENVVEAITIAALYVREVNSILESTYYDIENKVLFLTFDIFKYAISNVIIMNRAIIREKIDEIIKRCLKSKSISLIEVDKFGKELFSYDFMRNFHD